MITADRMKKTRQRLQHLRETSRLEHGKPSWDTHPRVKEAVKRAQTFTSNPEKVFGSNWKLYALPLHALADVFREQGDADALVMAETFDQVCTEERERVRRQRRELLTPAERHALDGCDYAPIPKGPEYDDYRRMFPDPRGRPVMRRGYHQALERLADLPVTPAAWSWLDYLIDNHPEDVTR